MKVKDVIQILQHYPEDREIKIRLDDDAYAYYDYEVWAYMADDKIVRLAPGDPTDDDDTDDDDD